MVQTKLNLLKDSDKEVVIEVERNGVKWKISLNPSNPSQSSLSQILDFTTQNNSGRKRKYDGLDEIDLDEERQKYECVICYQLPDERGLLRGKNCKFGKDQSEHQICHNCAPELLRRNGSCPICRTPYQGSKPFVNLVFTKTERNEVFQFRGGKIDATTNLDQQNENEPPHKIQKMDLPFACKICPQTFKCRQTLFSHQKKHFGQGYVCNVCNKKRFGKEHRCRGIIDRNFECSICKKGFSTKQKLKQHVDNKVCRECKICYKINKGLSSTCNHIAK